VLNDNKGEVSDPGNRYQIKK